MPRLSAVIGLGLLALAASRGFSQDFDAQFEPMTPSWSQPEPATRSRPSQYNERVYRRAVRRAAQRQARIELRKWQGRSVLRPYVGARPYAADLNAMASPWHAAWIPHAWIGWHGR